MSRTPILVLGDAPNLPTGLARIARDVVARMVADPTLDIDVAQLGLDYDGSPWPWRVYPVNDPDNWAEKDFPQTMRWHAGDQRCLILSFWDPSRCLPASQASATLWGYFAIDGENPEGQIGGPALKAVEAYDRVLAYTNYGSKVLAKSLDKMKVQWLPHGFDGEVFNRDLIDQGITPQQVIMGWPEDATVIGCVASNQPRKDLGLLFAALKDFKWQGKDTYLWLHIDFPIYKTWSVPELARVFGRNNEKLIVTTRLSDPELAVLYGSCKVTVAPGLGEGFCYPIVESLACGTPVVHFNYAGGAEWIPDHRWLVPATVFRVDGPYLIIRPVINGLDLRKALDNALLAMEDDRTTRAYCQGAVANLEWRSLWPRWRSWITQGLKELIADWGE
jgi:glycosyltransferase involved in cell wall biosynthesis